MKRHLLAIFVLFSIQAHAGEEGLSHVQVQTSLAAIQRGAETFMGQCHSCHTLKYMHYGDLKHFGMDQHKVDEWRGDQALDAIISSQMSEEAALQSFAKVPPDLSLMIKAREGGPDYVYSYLLGYYTDKDGMTANHVFPATKMPDILGGSITSDAAQLESIHKQASDIVSFLTWVADPHEQERRRLGYYVLAYLSVLTVLLYLVKDRVWSRLK